MRAALALVAVAACQSATAAPPAPAMDLTEVIKPPADWSALAPVVAAAELTGAHALAWGDPGRGCYAVVLGTRAPKQNPEDALAEFATTAGLTLGLTAWTVVPPASASGKIVRGELSGDVRATAVAAGTDAVVVLAACVAGPRDPAACAGRCQAVLSSFDAAKVVP